MAGLEAACSKGRKRGKPAGLTKEALEIAGTVKVLYDSGERSVNENIKGLGISRATCYRYIDIGNKIEKTKSVKNK